VGDQEPVVENEVGWRPSLRRFATGFLRPPPSAQVPTDDSSGGTSDEAKRRAVTYLDPLERKIGLVGAALAAAIALTNTLPYVLHPNTPVSQTVSPKKGHTCGVAGFTYDKATGKCNGQLPYSLSHWTWVLVILLAFAVALLIAVRVGRRAPLGFAFLMSGLAFDSQVGIYGLPFIAAGGWLLIRSWRVQRYGSTAAPKRGEKPQRPPPREPRKKKGEPPPGRPTPVASKRYTPKAVKKKRPPAPSRQSAS
jgi:hypothetical protein